ncbi:histidinol phosphatase [Runella aurantiaca]|uniref:protein-tyrosine-phosphatase n=2 Tax=Runella aurantiaca TaxID=2282308 RepID=A0A369IHQ1_9BACT|nr:histidinol phosphatase [Runella aurantiaca]
MSFLQRLFSGNTHRIFKWLATDMHSHLLPGIDDGSPDMPTTLHYLTELEALGYQKVITTPHVMRELYPNKPNNIKALAARVNEEITAAGLKIKLEASAEYMLDDGFDTLLENDQLIPIANRYVLVEMSYVAPTLNYENTIFKIQAQGLIPILAHPERYNYLSMNDFERIKSLGCLLQVNLLSLVGYYGKHTQAMGQQLVQNKQASFLGTDLHHSRHLEALKGISSHSKLVRLIENTEWLNAKL